MLVYGPVAVHIDTCIVAVRLVSLLSGFPSSTLEKEPL